MTAARDLPRAATSVTPDPGGDAGAMTVPSRARRAGQWIASTCRQRLWPFAALAFAAAAAATFTSSPGRYVPDITYEAFANPSRLLTSYRWLWVPAPELGRVRDGVVLAPPIVTAILRGLGLSVVASERTWHALVLAVAAAGAVAVLRLFRPMIRFEHVVAGLLYAFNPFTAVWLVPTTLFVPYALAPWIVVSFVRGVRESGWRWPAVFGLIVFVNGSHNPPSLAYACLPVLPAAVHVVVVERARVRAVASWIAKAGVLGVGCGAAALSVLPFSYQALVGLVRATEDPHLVNVASSWSETLRGLGIWVAYGRDPLGPWLPQTASYFTSPWVVLATFALPLAAVVAVWRLRWRERPLILAWIALSATFMVGAHPVTRPSPAGRFLLRLYDTVSAASGFRNSYKAGPGLLLGLTLAAGIGAAEVWRRWHPRRWLRPVAALGVLAVAGTASYPFWTGRLYNPRQQLRSVPAYWTDALRWIDSQPGDGRVLFAPGSETMQYRWGDPGTDIFDSLLRRPYVKRSWFATGEPEATNALDGLDDRIQSSTYVEGSIIPIARRLGVRFVVLRNDIDWQKTSTVRPAQLAPVRADLGSPAATFGRAGQNVLTPGDTSLYALNEALLPPVQVYDLGGSDGLISAVREGSPLLVSGDGAAWPQLARHGDLDRPLRYTGDQSPSDLRALLERPGASVVVTDTNRRRVRNQTSPIDNVSYTYPAGDGAAGPGLFAKAGTQTVATYGDASRIEASSYGPTLSGPQPWLRPAAAFDDDPLSAWVVGALGDPVGQWVRADLAKPTSVSHVRLAVTPTDPAGRRVSRVEVSFSRGRPITASVVDGHVDIEFPARTTTLLTFRIAGVTGPGLGGVGFSAITVDGLDLTERIALPSDLTAAASDAAVATALHSAALSYQFERSQLSASTPEETAVRRSFATPDDRSFLVDGTARLSLFSLDDVVDQALGQPVGATGSSRPYGGLRNGGLAAVDGDPATAWEADATAGQRLTVRFPRQVVSSIRIAPMTGDAASAISKARITVGAFSTDVQLTAASVLVPVPSVEAASAEIEIIRPSPRAGFFGAQPVGINEVEVNERKNLAPPSGPVLLPGCVSGIVSIDGRDVPLRLSATLDQLEAGQPVAVRGCDSVTLAAGEHRLDTRYDTYIDDLRLSSPSAERAVNPVAVPVAVTSSTPSAEAFTISSDAPGPVLVSNRAGFDPRWLLSSGGRTSQAVPVDGQASWEVPGSATAPLRVRFGPQRWLDRGIAVSALSVVLCLALLRPRRRRSPRPW